MADVNIALRVGAQVGSKSEGNMQGLGLKEELLHVLLENEQMRLVVWLFPLDHEKRHVFPSHSGRTMQDVGDYTPISSFAMLTDDSYRHLSSKPHGWNILVLRSSLRVGSLPCSCNGMYELYYLSTPSMLSTSPSLFRFFLDRLCPRSWSAAKSECPSMISSCFADF